MSKRNGASPALTTRSVTEPAAAALARLAGRHGAHPTAARKGLIRPGDPGGPCVRETCGHPGCEAARRVALSRCVRVECGLLIGYGIPVSAVRGGWAHEHCAMEMQLAEDQRRGLRGNFTAGTDQ